MSLRTAFVHLGSACNLRCPQCADRFLVGESIPTWDPELLLRASGVASGPWSRDGGTHRW